MILLIQLYYTSYKFIKIFAATLLLFSFYYTTIRVQLQACVRACVRTFPLLFSRFPLPKWRKRRSLESNNNNSKGRSKSSHAKCEIEDNEIFISAHIVRAYILKQAAQAGAGYMYAERNKQQHINKVCEISRKHFSLQKEGKNISSPLKGRPLLLLLLQSSRSGLPSGSPVQVAGVLAGWLSLTRSRLIGSQLALPSFKRVFFLLGSLCRKVMQKLRDSFLLWLHSSLARFC